MNRKFGEVSKILKIFCPWLFVKFSFPFYVLILKAPIVKNSHILDGIYVIFPKKCHGLEILSISILDLTEKIRKEIIKYEEI